MTINNILEQIATKGSIYDEIIDNIITTNQHLKPALISEVAIAYLENAAKIEEVYKQGYFKYYFIMTVKNQVHSSSSPLFKSTRIKETEGKGNYKFDEIEDDFETNLMYLEDMEVKWNDLQVALKNINMTFFESEMMRIYFKEGKSYRQIEAIYNIDHTGVYKVIKVVKQKILQWLKENDKL